MLPVEISNLSQWMGSQCLSGGGIGESAKYYGCKGLRIDGKTDILLIEVIYKGIIEYMGIES